MKAEGELCHSGSFIIPLDYLAGIRVGKAVILGRK
jgi:hypothetical protein